MLETRHQLGEYTGRIPCARLRTDPTVSGVSAQPLVFVHSTDRVNIIIAVSSSSMVKKFVSRVNTLEKPTRLE